MKRIWLLVISLALAVALPSSSSSPNLSLRGGGFFNRMPPKKEEAPPRVPTMTDRVRAAGVLGPAAAASYSAMQISPEWLSTELGFGLQRWQILLSGSYALFFAANLLPGRLDTKLGRPKKEDMRFFTPAGWAFAIWGPIFLGELLMSFWVFAPRTLAPAGAGWLREVAPYYAAASISQALWCISFREWALPMLWVPATLLSVSAAFMFGAHAHLADAATGGGGATFWGHLVFRIPATMHFGWLCAAALLSWNNHLSTIKGFSTQMRAATCIGTCYAAAGALAWISVQRQDGIPSLVGAWSLWAVSKGHEVLRGAVDNTLLDTVNTSAAVCAVASLFAAAAAWILPLLQSA